MVCCHSGRVQLWIVWVLLGVLLGSSLTAEDSVDDLFERDIRPLLIEKCSACHTGSKNSGGLNLESRMALMTGGDSGSSLNLNQPDSSLLLQAVRRSEELAMPPDDPLSKSEVAAIEAWIKLGAPWPKTSHVLSDEARNSKMHWAFQPVSNPQIPTVENQKWVRNPIDAFVLSKLNQEELTPNAVADRRRIARRLNYTLTGLPPSSERMFTFIVDQNPKAYNAYVDELLASPQYGEHWARHWLDVARYSDTKGYVYAREERFWVHAWSYRDWVVNALNRDLPYDQFLKLQIAADQVDGCQSEDLAAMGFLTLGRRFLGVPRDIIDDRIDTVSRGTMGLTVACARCHDHKYDPIPTADYYSLYGIFASSEEHIVRAQSSPASEAYEAELSKRKTALATKLSASRIESSDRARSRVQDYLQAQLELDKYPPQGFDQIFEKSDLLPAFVRRWQTWLHHSQRSGEPVFAAWHLYRSISDDQFSSQSKSVTNQLSLLPDERLNPLVRKAFETPPTSFADVIDRYSEVLSNVESQWQEHLKSNPNTDRESLDAPSLSDPAAEQVRQLLYGSAAPCEVPDQPLVHIETFFDSGTVTALWKLHGEADRWVINSNEQVAHAIVLEDAKVPFEPRVFRRGNPVNFGDDVPRQFLQLLSSEDRQPFSHGSGRRELADAITSPQNPLTARVIVNRVWTHHFGQGFVSTPSDFGLRAKPPSHPELLDWLTTWFINEGWSLKKLHRLILTSNTYRQSSFVDSDSTIHQRAALLDPENRLLWRMNRHRLSFEEFRDSLLATANQLDRTPGGKPIPLFKAPYPKRRTLYGLIDRQYLPNTLRIFDFANPDLHIPNRSETTVPQQALFLLNHPLMLEQVRAIAKDIADIDDTELAVSRLFQRTLQRNPDTRELADAVEFIDRTSKKPTEETRATAADWHYGFGKYDEEKEQTSGFTPLPHFTGDAWQGSAAWPDSALGWVQLTSTGGHPGNDRAHAAIRRWVAPRSMTIQIHSTLVNEAAPGDGVRAFIVSSQSGKLSAKNTHQELVPLNVDEVQVDAGETIDFVVDINEVLNSDQFVWEITIQESENKTQWNSKLDFPRNEINHLTPWEQFAQVLYCTNEFLFVD